MNISLKKRRELFFLKQHNFPFLRKKMMMPMMSENMNNTDIIRASFRISIMFELLMKAFPSNSGLTPK